MELPADSLSIGRGLSLLLEATLALAHIGVLFYIHVFVPTKFSTTLSRIVFLLILI